MPEAVLSAVVFLIGVDLIDDKGMRKIYNQRRSEFWVALITMLMVIFVFVEQGVVVAIVLSLIDHTRRGYHPTNMLLAPGESGIFKQNSLESHTQARPGLMIYRFTHSMYFANAQQLSEEVTTLVKHAEPPLRWFCIEASAVDDIDVTSAETLAILWQQLKEHDVRLVVAQVMLSVSNKSHYQLRQLLGEDACFETLHDVLAAYDRKIE